MTVQLKFKVLEPCLLYINLGSDRINVMLGLPVALQSIYGDSSITVHEAAPPSKNRPPTLTDNSSTTTIRYDVSTS